MKNSLGISLASLFFFALAALPAHAGEIKGRLLVGEKPAAGATISALSYETPFDRSKREAKRGPDPAPLAKASAGPDGAFTLTVPAAEAGAERPFRILVEGAGAVPALFDGVWDASENDDLGEHALLKAEKLAGTVVDASGAAVAGAEVVLTPSLDRFADGDFSAAPRHAVTGADGTFRFEEASSTGNTIEAGKAGAGAARQTALRSGALAKPVALAPGVTATGSVKKSDRKSTAAGALVRIEGRTTTRWVETGADGTFTISNAPDGRILVVADAGEAGYAELQDAKLPLAEGKKLALTLAPPASLEGKTVDAKTGRPVPRVKIEARGGGAVRTARSAPDGSYRLRALPPRTWRVKADEPRYVSFTKDALVLTGGEARKLDIPLILGATMIGRVVDDNGQPVAGAKGQLARGGETGLGLMLRQMRAGDPTIFRSTADGTFKASRLMPGENQRLTVAHPEYERTTLGGLALAAGATKSGVAIVMRRGATIVGLVKDANGDSVAGAEVELAQSANFQAGRGGAMASINFRGGPGQRPREKTGADGRFQFKGLSAGEYALVVRKPGLATERLDPVRVPEEGSPEAVTMTLAPGAIIAGRVVRKSGGGAEGFFVTASPPGRPRFGPGGSPLTEQPTGSDGAFLIEGLKAGETYDLQTLSGLGPGAGKRGVVAGTSDVEILVAGAGRIAGIAMDAATGRPLTDFQVSYEPDRGGGGAGMVFRFASRAGTRLGGVGERHTVKSDDGSFVLEDVTAGTWSVVVEAKGYQSARAGGVVVEDGGTKSGVEVKASPGVVLKGHVTDATSSRAVPNASITVQAAGGAAGPMMMLGGALGENDVTTDADGRFQIEDLAPGKQTINVKHPDYSDLSETVDVKDNTGTVELHVTAGGAVGGVVVSESHQPLSGVDVSLAAAGDAGFSRMMGLGGGQATVTDSAGHFRFDHLTAGRYSVTASVRNKASTPQDVVLQAGESKDNLALSVSAGSTVQGTVTGVPDAWKNGMTVTASGPEAYFASMRTGADARFQFTGVPAGTINLRATGGDFISSSRSAGKQVTTSDAQPILETEITFDSGFTLAGRVTKSGQPLSGATVFATLQGGGGRQSSSRSDDSGAYRLEGLVEGTYTVNAMSDLMGSGSSKRETVTLSQDQTLDLVFPTAKIGGSVVDAAGKAPLPDAAVDIGGGRMTTTDSNGQFVFSDIDPKSYTVTVRKTDYQFDKRDVTAADQGTDSLLIELTRGEGIGIQVKDGIYNVPLRGVMVRAFDGTNTAVFTASVSLDTEGKGEVSSLKPGRYRLMVDANGYAPAVLDGISVPSQTVPVTLTPGGTIEIHAGEKSLANGTLKGTLKTAAGQPYGFSLFNLDGRIVMSAPVRRIENVAPGTYLLAIDGGDTKTIAVNEGGTAIVQLP